MNRAILLVICDFLLLSLLGLARFDRPEEEEQPPTEAEVQAQSQVKEDLMEVLELSLEAEASQRAELRSQLEERESQLQQRAQEIEEKEQAIREREAEAQQLAQAKSQLEQERQQLSERQRQLQESLQQTEQQLSSTAEERQAIAQEQAELRETLATARERQRALQQQLEERQNALSDAEQRAEQARQERETVERERAILETQLASAETEQQRLNTELEVERQEKQAAQQQVQQLTSTVDKQVEQQRETIEEVKKLQEKSINTIFTAYRDNRVPAEFSGRVPTLFGSRSVGGNTRTLFVSDGSGVYAIFQAGATPFNANDLERLESASGSISFGGQRYSVSSVGFTREDPRIVTVKVPRRQVESAGIEVFELAKEPLRFSETVLTGAVGEKYGALEVRVKEGTRRYLDVDQSLFRSLFGNFSPSSGDFVWSKTGELIGVMVDDSTAIILSDLSAFTQLSLGEGFSTEEAERVGSQVKQRLR